MSIGFKNWDLLLKDYFHKEIHFLEIGVYKGEIVKRIAPVFLDHPNSSYTGVDTWKGSEEYMDTDFEEIERMARESAKSTGKLNQITFLKMSSFDGLFKLTQEKRIFDIIFIDASHEGRDVISDAVLAWRLLKTNGILIFDDYIWNKLSPAYYTPKPAIDSFVYLYKDEVKILKVERQFYLQKIKPTRKPYLTLLNDKLTELLDKFWNKYKEEIYIPLPIVDTPKLVFKLTPLFDLKKQVEKHCQRVLELIIKETDLRFLGEIYTTLDLSVSGLSDIPLFNKIKEFELIDNNHVHHYYFLKVIFNNMKVHGLVDILYFRAHPILNPKEYYKVRSEMVYNMINVKTQMTILNNLEIHKNTNEETYIDITFNDIEKDLLLIKPDISDVYFGMEGWHNWIIVSDLKSTMKFISNQQKYIIYSLVLGLKTLRNGGTFIMGCNDFGLPFIGDFIIILQKLFKKVVLHTFFNIFFFPHIQIIAYDFKKNTVKLDKLTKTLIKLYESINGNILESFLDIKHNIHEIISDISEPFLADCHEIVNKYINKYSYQLLDPKNKKILSDLHYQQQKRTIEDIYNLFRATNISKNGRIFRKTIPSD